MVVIGCEYITQEFSECFEKLKGDSTISPDMFGGFEGSHKENSDIQYEIPTLTDGVRHSSPFYKTFAEVKHTVEQALSDELSVCEKQTVNRYYSPEFLDYMLEYLLPYFPLWSAFVLTKFNLARDSNASVENYFKIVKKDILRKELRIPAPRFIRTMESLLDGRLRDRKYIIQKKWSNPKKRNPDAPELAVETWKDGKRPRRNVYFKIPKRIGNIVKESRNITNHRYRSRRITRQTRD